MRTSFSRPIAFSPADGRPLMNSTPESPNDKEIVMSQTIQERNKALVLEAFDTLFNKRDYVAPERYWSPAYVQHSTHIAPGCAGLFTLIKSMPATLKYEPGMV